MQKKHCCEQMVCALECEVAIKYIEKFREYGILILDGGTSFQDIGFCPWCGSKLPDSLRDQWFEIVFDELGLEGADDPKLPKNMMSDMWWQDLKL